MERVVVIEIPSREAVRVLTFSSGRVNALDVALLAELTAAIREQQKPGVGALVITGAGGAFSAGVDLARVIEGGAGYTAWLIPALSEAFETLFCHPGPTVAAINGAANAGGCVLACACDRRLISPDITGTCAAISRCPTESSKHRRTAGHYCRTIGKQSAQLEPSCATVVRTHCSSMEAHNDNS
jgi:enoyl-CoA hydratase/carnithine racemase